MHNRRMIAKASLISTCELGLQVKTKNSWAEVPVQELAISSRFIILQYFSLGRIHHS